jgi:hypothetical protein
MKLNLNLITETLEQSSYILVGNPDAPPNLCGISPLVPGFMNAPDILSLASWEDIRAGAQLPGHIACVGGGEQAVSMFREHGISGLVLADEPTTVAFRRIQDVFIRYDKLERNLLNTLLTNSPTRAILNCISAFFECHLMLFGSDLRLLDYSDNFLPAPNYSLWRDTLAQRRSVLAMTPREKVKMLPNKSTFPNCTFLDSLEGVLPHFNYAFDYGDSRFATLIIMQTEKPLSEHQQWLVDALAKLISPVITERYNSVLESRNYFRKTIAAFLRGGTPDNLPSKSYLNKFGWHKDDDYQILLVSLPPESAGVSHYIYNYENVFAGSYSNCIALRFDDFILILLHGSACSLLPECLPTLDKQLELDGGVCGVGLQFSGFSELRTHYELTVLTFQHCPNSKRIRRYTEILPEHMVSELNSRFPLRSVCHRSVVRIAEYDKENDTNYLTTLETYLMYNKSLEATSNKLFIHRNTMAYRLKCIKKIAEMDLDDPSERLGILLSCMVLRILDNL